MLRAVVPLMSGQRRAGFVGSVVDELVAFPFGKPFRRLELLRVAAGRGPRCAPIVGPRNDLPEPAAGLRAEDAVGIDGRALEVINLPAAEARPADVPFLPLAVGGQDERALLRAHQNSNAAHIGLLKRDLEP